MRSFNLKEEYNKLLTPEIVALLAQIHEYKGKYSIAAASSGDALGELVEIAKIQSTEASNRIEGIITTDDRLKKLVREKTMPENRSEREIAGYRDVLALVHESYEYIPARPGMILQLHRDLNRYNGNIGGSFKASDNIIRETLPDGSSRVRFSPVPAWEAPEAVAALCDNFNEVLGDGEADPLLLIPIFILDFLCIHPFSDGNGRMSRLLTLLLLYRAGYYVGRYISIEKIIAAAKDSYYDALQLSSTGWHENENDYLPFVRYMLGVVVAAYKDFAERFDLLISKSVSKPDRIKAIIKGTIGKITKTEIMEKCPDISQTTVQRTLNDLITSNEIIKIGGGRYTSYLWNWEK